MNYLDNNKVNTTCATFLNADWENADFYAEYLAQSYYYICHSTKLLALAVAFSNEDQKDFYRRSINHISEEDGHQYLAKSDLKKLGFSINDFSESSFTRALWEPQYYKIQRVNTSILGYILGLECIAAKTFNQLYKMTLNYHGNKATNFIRVHAEEDPGHVEKAIEEVLKLSSHELELVNQNYIQTVDMFGSFIEECTNSSVLPERGHISLISEIGA